jgi:ABC-2 type transport system ATP-binding protein
VIDIRYVSFKYPKRPTGALDDVSVIARGKEIVSLLGPNGAGKTTLLRVLSGLIQPSSGSVTVCNYDMQTHEYQARACIGLVLGEERSFYYRLSGAQNLEFFGGLYGIQRSILKMRIPQLLDRVGLLKDAKLQYMRYSTGMKKRLGLARALLHEPQVLLLDEPNSGIDPQSARTIRSIITDLKEQGRTIFMTTHDMVEAERLSDRIGFLREGKLVKVGTVDEFRGTINKKRLEITFASGPAPVNSADIDALVARIRRRSNFESIAVRALGLTICYNGSFDMNAVLRDVADSGLIIERTNTCTASLEEVFIKLTEN